MRILNFLLYQMASPQVLYYSAFTSTSFTTSESWTLQNVNGLYSDCGATRILGGYNCFGVAAQAMLLLQLPPHYQIDITLEFWRVDSWDGEHFNIYLDQILTFDQTYVKGSGSEQCGRDWEDQYHSLTINQSHFYQSVYILLTSTLDQHSLDESWGIRDFNLYQHLCPPGCSSCETNDQRWECIPWILLNSAFLSVTSAGFSDDGWTITSGTQSTSLCANVPLFGGYNLTAQNSQILQTYLLPFHSKLLIKFRIAFLDSWDNEFAYLYVDGIVKYSEKYHFGSGNNDQFSTSKIIINHSAEKITIVFKSTLNETPNNESFGIRDIQIFTFRKSYCGNSITEYEESCDDGNIYPFDGCFNCEYSCVEGCSNCIEGICWECEQGWQFETLNNNCFPQSDDQIIVSKENCDDVMNFEICKNGEFKCQLNCVKCQFGICKKCSNNYILIENQCQPICQNLIYVNDLQCYDDNLKALDQCYQCYDDIEQGCIEFRNGMCIQCENDWNFDFQLRKCIPICGDNKVNGDEQCDISKYSLSKQKFDCDSCQFSCQLQCTKCVFGQCFECKNGWKLNNFKCETICGDLYIEGLEDCDDQNQIQNDGCYQCKNSCQIQCTECFRGMCYNCLQGWYLDENQICQSQCGDQQVALLSNEECDDNTQLQEYKCLDCKISCYSYCSICLQGICFSCQYTFSLIDDFCVPVCGDGLISEDFEQCDDMNLIPYDGCFQCQYQCRKNCKQCIKGVCYDACEYGFYLVDDNCITICGDGIIAGEENCDDQNDQMGDGCHKCEYECPQDCQICEQGICKICDLGFDLIKEENICKGVCGNEFTQDEEECDDQNKNDGDGCSQFCKVEENYVCNNFQQSFSECIYSKQPEFLMKFVEERNQIQFISLYFSQQVKTVDKIIYSESIDLVIVDMDPSYYSLKLVVIQEALDNVQNVEYLVEVSFFQNMDSIPQLQATLNNPLYNIDNAELLNYIGIVNLQIPKYLDDQKQKGAETLKSFNQYIANSMGGIGFVAILLGNSLFLESVLEVLQQQSYLRFINVVFPFNLYIYFESSNFISIKPLLDYVKFEKFMAYFNTEQIYVESYQKLKFYQINADLFTNIQGQILQIILIGISYVVCTIINRIILSLEFIKQDLAFKYITLILNYIQKTCQDSTRSYNLEMLKVLLRANSWDLLFTIFLQIKCSKDNQFRSIFGNVIALIFFYSGCLIINKLVHKNQFGLKGFFHYWQSKFDLFTTLKKLLFIAVLVLFQDNQMLQTILLSIIGQFYLIYIVKFKPAQTQVEYLNLIMMEGSAFIFTVTSVFYWQQMSKYIAYEKQIILGWFHI